MKSPLIAFEEYVNSLVQIGVYPSFHRVSMGWACTLRNASGKQLMPFKAGENCWGDSLMNSLTVAVEGLNNHFKEPKELHHYIKTGIDQSPESLQTIKTDYAQ